MSSSRANVSLWHTADIPEYSIMSSSSVSGQRKSNTQDCCDAYNLPPLWPCILGTAMDERVEALLADVLALEGEDPNVIREGVRGALADYEQLFRAQEVK
jgi:hypothetical protein